MSKVSEIIKRLEELKNEYGNVEFTIYKSFDEQTVKTDVDEINYDNKKGDIYLGIYN